MPCLLEAVKNFLQQHSTNPDPFYPLPPCEDFNVTSYSVQFTCNGLDVDVMLTYDWDSDDGGGYIGLYANSMKETSARGRQW